MDRERITEADARQSAIDRALDCGCAQVEQDGRISAEVGAIAFHRQEVEQDYEVERPEGGRRIMAAKALPGEERPRLGLARDRWEYAAAEMRRGYYWEGFSTGRVISIHPESGLGYRERLFPGLVEIKKYLRGGGA